MTSRALAIKQPPQDDLGSIYSQDDEQERLAGILEQRYQAMLKALHAIVAAAYPELEQFRLGDDAVNRILIEAASRVVRIDEVTRRAIAEQLRLGQALGLSSWEIANGKPDLGYRGIDGLFQETWRGRAETVARNELTEAQYLASLDRYRATGLIDRVKAVDGDDDEPCRSRNGKVYTIEQAPSRAHVNCTLALIPVLREDIAP